MLYIPYGWFHEAESEGPSVSYTLRMNHSCKNDLEANLLLLHKYASTPLPVQANLLEMSINLPDVPKYYFMKRAACAKYFKTIPHLPTISAEGRFG
jgi:oxalate decarboxylase/phosphoglucose isomerase-like protein (cupin superfamily)